MSNLYEFLSGTSLNEVDPEPSSLYSREPLTLEYSERTRLDPGNGFTPEWSPDLVHWYESGDGPPGDPRSISIVTLPPEASPEGRTIRRAQLEGGNSRAFLQVRGALSLAE